MSRMPAFGLQPLQPALPSHLQIISPKFGLEEWRTWGLSQICNLEKGVSDANYREMAKNQLGTKKRQHLRFSPQTLDSLKFRFRSKVFVVRNGHTSSGLCIFVCAYQEV